MKKHSNINSCSNIWDKDLLTDSINCSWDEISLFDSDCDLEYEFFRSNEHDSDEELMEEGVLVCIATGTGILNAREDDNT
ncbi:hypothetical protein JG687_00017893 [Phytophthora cactorum]|uniref:Uncharacterized protein n=1 Tax=Phytophthora cactorum TaxID=29920 RepID=A0A329SL66_9STRA|nr:hypothetical protein Pcac1_g23876 [Phytophthora cactorum]KAG2818692.1 hypothetical protein PC113_g22829 [Phytophthora cactorum]KAG2847121.1 hypothetical protein PC111_g951 [Phytophthora cactorum]KAG2847891.1 hypothetical protein PC112_g937 [Phytophthora cactorum]KAG2873896.1 hypothetical protein PC114_g25597 [Phytophthora cactorum]